MLIFKYVLTKNTRFEEIKFGKSTFLHAFACSNLIVGITYFLVGVKMRSGVSLGF